MNNPRKVASELCEFHPEFRAKLAVICAALALPLNTARLDRIRELHKTEHAARLGFHGHYVTGSEIAEALLDTGMENALRQAGAE